MLELLSGMERADAKAYLKELLAEIAREARPASCTLTGDPAKGVTKIEIKEYAANSAEAQRLAHAAFEAECRNTSK